MDKDEAAAATREVVARYDAAAPAKAAAALREIWLRAVPDSALTLEAGAQKLVRDWGIKDEEYEALGVPVPVLTVMGRQIGLLARRRVDSFLPLTQLLWDDYGREGRIVAVVAMGPMELAEPEAVVPALYGMARTCAFWEDCDQLAMKALEPVLRHDPEAWLERLAAWVSDDNKWVRRAAITAIGRLPMRHPERAAHCVELVAPALGDADTDVKRALSFALRTCARGDTEPVTTFIRARAHLVDADSLWVLCDVVRSLWRRLLPAFSGLLPVYRAWLETAPSQAHRSVQGAIRLLEGSAEKG
jgi:3-methyladenine DNA glycosylase AlkD